MDAADRKQDAEIIEKMTAKSAAYSFVQATRLLLHHLTDSSPDEISHNEILDRHIRIRPELSLRFPGTDISSIEKISDDPLQYLITATFLGLYGASSPLPTFYTEDLIDEFNDDKSIKRDFIDIINYTIYPIFFKIWSKYRLYYKICEERDQTFINILYSLLGLENRAIRDRIHNIERYFRYTGLTLQFPRSAEGLVSIISDGFNLAGQVRIEQCVARKVSIPEDQQLLLGLSACTLGEETVIGTQIDDISGKFQIRISDADAKTLHAFLPHKNFFIELKQMVEFYVNQPLAWDLVVEIKESEIETAQPGSKTWSHLGWNTWLISGDNKPKKLETQFSAF